MPPPFTLLPYALQEPEHVTLRSAQLPLAPQQQEQQPPQPSSSQQPPRPGSEPIKARSPLGHILTPVYYLLQQGTQTIAQRFGTPGSAAEQRQQRLQQQAGSHGRRAEGDPSGTRQALALEEQRLDACATSTTSTATGSALVPEASDSEVGPGAGSGAPAPGAPALAESGCDSDGDVAASACALQPGTQPQVTASQQAADVSDEDDDEEWFDPLLFISRLPPVAPPGSGRPGLLLPRRTRACKQKTLVLDLDETLVHSTLDSAPGAESADFHFPVLFNGAEHMVHVRMRPYMRQFLEHAADLFEVVVFTASQKVYAEKLLNILDPQRRLIRHRIYRDSCVFVEGNYLKVGPSHLGGVGGLPQSHSLWIAGLRGARCCWTQGVRTGARGRKPPSPHGARGSLV
jgi:hypothetical protein